MEPVGKSVATNLDLSVILGKKLNFVDPSFRVLFECFGPPRSNGPWRSKTISVPLSFLSRSTSFRSFGMTFSIYG
jgi:hypothetical protein